jgi:hypothetical protein
MPDHNPFASYAKRIHHKKADVERALGDYFALRANLPIRDPDPYAESLIETRHRLVDIAAHLDDADPDESGHMLTRRLTSAAFQSALETASATAVGIAYAQQAAEWKSLVRSVPSRGMKGIEAPLVDVGEVQDTTNAGLAARMPLVTVDPGTAVTPRTYASRFLISRELMANDSADAIALAWSQLAGAYARLPMAMIASLVETNANLADGAPLIGSSNTTSGTGLDATTIGQALALLRTATTRSGNVANVRGAILMCPPSMEGTALILNESMRGRFTIAVNSWLTTDDVYMLADPTESITFLHTFPDSLGEMPTVDTVRPYDYGTNGEVEHYDGIAHAVRFVVGINAVDRSGIAKIGA